MAVAEGNRTQKQYELPLPLTLYSFVELSQSLRRIQKFEETLSHSKRHRSEAIRISRWLQTLPLGFHGLTFTLKEDGSLCATTYLTFPEIPSVRLQLTVAQNRHHCQFETHFDSESKMSEAFSKVILQALMFMVG
jgi:hypothetical protein